MINIWNSELSEAIEDYKDTKKAKKLSAWKAKFLERDENNLFIAKGQKENARLVELSKIYSKYQEELNSNGLYDYDDMIIRAIEALKKNDELRFNLQEKYLYIMLDEYQDTNKAQAELVEQLTNNEASEGRPNIMAVGDDDQAIYAFQGAKHSNMLDFVNAYRDVEVITLETNYRSTQNIIDLSSQTATQIKSRVTELLSNESKDFKANSKDSGDIRSLALDNEVIEYGWLAKDIKKSKAGSIAIIAPEHKYLERASSYLLAEDIPISYERRENILDDPKIKQIINFMRLLKAIADQGSNQTDSLLASVLNYDFWQLPTEAIWKLSWSSNETRSSWLDLMLKDSKLRQTALMLIKLAANSLEYRFDFILDQIIGLSDIRLTDKEEKSTRSPFLEYYSKEGDVVISQLFQNLITLKQKLTEFNGANQRPLMTADFIEYIDQLQLSEEKVTNDLKYTQASSRVELMSAHGAKGQEFDSVYLISFVNEAWGVKADRGKTAIPINLEYIRQRSDDADDERLRLLYVALSRAKTSLTTLSYNQDYEARETTPIKYLSLDQTKPKLNFRPNLIPLWQQEERQIEIPADLKSLLSQRLEKYVLSPTDLRTFTDVSHAGPQVFYDRALLKYKTYTTTHMDYGSAVHNTLDWLQKSVNSKGKAPELKELLKIYETNLQKRRLMPHDYSRLKEQGIDALTSFYVINKDSLSASDLSEYDFRNEGEVINGNRVTGQVDKLIIDKDKKQIEIIDYKTGKGERSWTSEAKMYLYRNQLYFYKLLAEGSTAFKGYTVTSARLDFIQATPADTTKFRVPLEYDKQFEERLVKLVDAVWKHISELSFPDISSYKPNLKGIIQFEDDLINGRI
ncbi:MAG: ATP-dependent DNA helicase [Candidatus Saccharibacteria bacterium]